MNKQSNLTFRAKPKLRRPSMVCGISGWVDGGQAATGTVQYLKGKLKAKRLAEIPIDRFHIFQVPGQVTMRPHIKLEDGLLKQHDFPKNLFFCWANPGGDRDVILFEGTEPNMNWPEYAAAILQLAEQFGVSRIYLLGGVLDKTPHTREPNVSCACSSADLKEEMRRYGVQFSNYEGPGRFGTTLLHFCQQRRFPLVGLTVRATYYPEFSIVIPRNPKSIRALVLRLKGLLQLDLDISDLDAEAAAFEDKLGGIAARNQEFRAYVESLEREYVELRYEEPLGISGDEAVRIAEELLKGKAEP
jgi:proteasome assembly chaperone (PAC2) family protein